MPLSLVDQGFGMVTSLEGLLPATSRMISPRRSVSLSMITCHQGGHQGGHQRGHQGGHQLSHIGIDDALLAHG